MIGRSLFSPQTIKFPYSFGVPGRTLNACLGEPADELVKTVVSAAEGGGFARVTEPENTGVKEAPWALFVAVQA
jgi:hypothetical protein